MRHDESLIQRACVRWFRMQYPELATCLISVPNGVCTSASQGRILKAEGMTAGAADLLLLVPRGGCGSLALELKTSTGRQSDAQKKWQRDYERAGNRYVICRSFDEFMTEVNEYLSITQQWIDNYLKLKQL